MQTLSDVKKQLLSKTNPQKSGFGAAAMTGRRFRVIN